MFPYTIMTDSTADLPQEVIDKYDLKVINLTYNILGKSYGHGEELDPKDFYGLMRAGNLPSTSQVNPEEAKECFANILKDNKNLLYVAFSSGLSGTYNSGRIAAEEMKEDDPSLNIEVVDTFAASLGEGLMVYYACKNREEGMSLEDNAKWLKEHANNFVHMFTVDDLNHLFRGGRVSKSTAFVGTVLNIKPILHVDNEGHLIPLTKVRGRKKSLLSLVDEMEKRMGSYKDKNPIVFISHGDCLEDAEFVKNEVSLRFGINEFIINFIGPTIGAHAGPGTVALFFLGDEK